MSESEILKMFEEQKRLIRRQTRILVEIAEMIKTSDYSNKLHRFEELDSSLNLVKSIARDEIY